MGSNSGQVRLCVFQISPVNYIRKRAAYAPQALETATLKTALLKAYAGRVPGYIFDIICHIADNPEQNREMLRIVRKYGGVIGGSDWLG
ncbi:hypothetical protein BH09PSE4_BH09PSE4_15920 [soil metagenome]